jgi:hypothetical protein
MRVDMFYELDHLFICTSAGSPEAGILTAFGLTEGPGNTHPGQGTDHNIHAGGYRSITRVKIIAPHGGVFSSELKAIAEAGLVGLGSGEEYLMEIGFDGEHETKAMDFRPALPLVFRW